MTNTMSCGCEIISDNLGAYKIDYCPKHGAASELCEVLRNLGLYVAVHYDSDNKPYYYIDQEWMDKRVKVLARAGGICKP